MKIKDLYTIDKTTSIMIAGVDNDASSLLNGIENNRNRDAPSSIKLMIKL